MHRYTAVAHGKHNQCNAHQTKAPPSLSYSTQRHVSLRAHFLCPMRTRSAIQSSAFRTALLAAFASLQSAHCNCSANCITLYMFYKSRSPPSQLWKTRSTATHANRTNTYFIRALLLNLFATPVSHRLCLHVASSYHATWRVSCTNCASHKLSQTPPSIKDIISPHAPFVRRGKGHSLTLT